MQILFLLKVFGSRLLAQELADLLTHHISTNGFAALKAAFAEGAAACDQQLVAGVAQAVTDLLTSVK